MKVKDKGKCIEIKFPFKLFFSRSDKEIFLILFLYNYEKSSEPWGIVNYDPGAMNWTT